MTPRDGAEQGWDRRDFLIRCAAAGAAFGLGLGLEPCLERLEPCLGRWLPSSLAPIDALPHAKARAEDVAEPERGGKTGRPAPSDHVASHWEPREDRSVQCRLCPRACVVRPGSRGFCRVRENDGGTYRSLVHSRVSAAHVDPIEKKPFFHVLPGTNAFSIATAGCNLRCRFCQNWEISQASPGEIDAVIASPEQVASAAAEAECPVLAFTYAEPTVFWEFARDVADAGRTRGIRSVFVSNGYQQEAPLREIVRRLAAVKIDLKGFTEAYYEEVCGAKLAPVKRTLEILKEEKVWFEIVCLIVPTRNDDEAQMRDLCAWVAERLGPETPVHFTAFHPAYRLSNLPSTPVATLDRIHGYAAEEGLKFAYVGNVPGHPAQHTYCPGCGATLVRRSSYTILEIRLRDGRCPDCGRAIPGVWT